MASETLYCLCRRPYEDEQFMIECEICKDWYHGSCVGIKEHQASEIETYHCPDCQINHGPLVLKKKRNLSRRNYSESDDNISKTVQTGSIGFIRELKNRTFPSADDVPIIRLPGRELSKEYLEENGFDVPVMVACKDGLDLKVPPTTFTIQDVENHVGSMREIDVIDVAKQEDVKMLMREWTEYYNSPNRQKIFNVISLEFSNTKLADLVDPPRVVKELSWVSRHWPTDQPTEDAIFQKPEVQRYCLMGIKDSFTDFHIDFGGTSVWYHVLKGEKVFYLIRPTPANLALYERWMSSSSQGATFFGDQADTCYKCVVKTGHTLFIPTGWIHAVFTPIDSLVFGGNFLHDLNIDLQIQVYEIEKRVKTPVKYMFPNYETVHWYAAKHILDVLKECHEDAKKPLNYLVAGAKALATSLKAWTHKKDRSKREFIRRDSIPETVQYGKLLKELNKELKIVGPKGKTPEGKRKRRRTTADEDKEEKPPKVKVQKRSQDTSQPFGGPGFLSKPQLKVEHEVKAETPGKPKKKAPPEPRVRTPKAEAAVDASVYDFTDEEDCPVKAEAKGEGHTSPRGAVGSPRPGSLLANIKGTGTRTGMGSPPAGGGLTLLGVGAKSPLRSPPAGGGRLTLGTSIATGVGGRSSLGSPSAGAGRLTLGSSIAGVGRRLSLSSPVGGGAGQSPLSSSSGAGSSLGSLSPGSASRTPTPLGSPPVEGPGVGGGGPLAPLSHKDEARSPKAPVAIARSGASTVAALLQVGAVVQRTTPLHPPPGAGQQQSGMERLRLLSTKPSGSGDGGQMVSALKLKLAAGKIISGQGEIGSPTGQFHSLGSVVGAGAQQMAPPPDALLTEDPDEDGDQLVVDDSPLKSLPATPAGSALKPGSLKMRLSVNKIAETPLNTSQESGTVTSQSESDSDLFATPASRANIPTIQGGLNGSISDILEASGYGTETDFKIDDDIKTSAASPTMRDAIQGMLSMSRMGGLQLSSLANAAPGAEKGPRPPVRPRRPPATSEETADKLPTCFKDGEFVYLTLDTSDTEEDKVFKSRGRPRKDETWNPKAKLNPNCPKPDRPQREGTRRESVESGLAAAAAKLAHLPPPKRQYIRRKPKPDKKQIPPSLDLELPSTSALGLPLDIADPILDGSSKKCTTPGSPTKGKKPKKGMATAKQRLGKILKIHKMVL